MSDSSLPEAGARLTLDLSEWESNWSSAISDAESLQSTIDDLGGSLDIDVNMDIPDTSDLDAITDLDGESIETEIDATQDDASKSIVDNLNFLAAVEKIKLAIDIAGNVWDFAQQVGGNLLNPFLDVEQVVSRINAQTGGTGIADLGDLIRDIQYADLGDSADQIGDVIIAAEQLKLPIKDAATAALTFTHTWQEQDPTKVVEALGTTLKTGIVDNLQIASDLMTVFFQQGGNIGGDALQVVQANAQSWADMGLNLQQALSLMTSLQDGTGATASDAAKMLQTMDDAFTTAAADPTSQQAKMLKVMGIDNPKDAGKAIGAEAIDGFAEAFANLPADQQDLVSGMFFGKGGKKFTGAISDMTTEAQPFADVVGAASDAATEIDNNLRGVIDDFVLAMNEKLSELLSSDAIDIPGKIEDLKNDLKAALDVLASGGTLGEAIEVGFHVEGVDTALGNIQRVFGQMVLALLDIVAFIQDPTGTTDKDAQTQTMRHQLANQQLPFDLQLANADEIPGIIAQAMSRGVTGAEVNTALTTAANEALTKGDFSTMADIFNGLIEGAAKEGVDPTAAQNFAEGYIGQLRPAFETAIQSGDFDLASQIADAMLLPPDIAKKIIDDAKAALSAAYLPQDRTTGDGQNPFMAFGTSAGKGDPLADTKTAVTDLDTTTATAADSMATNWNNMGISLTGTTQTVIDQMDQTAAKVTELDATVGEKLTDNTVTASFDAVAQSAGLNFPSVIAWFDKTAAEAAQMDLHVSGSIQHMLNLLHDLQFLSAQVATGVQQTLALGGQLPSGGTTNNTTNNVTVNNNVQTGAHAVANGYAIGASLRPGGA